MERRDFLLNVLAGLGAAAGCASTEGALEPWKLGLPTQTADFCSRVAAAGLLAPSPHNRQPWRVRLVNAEELELFIDDTRTNLRTDPLLRQVYVSQGAFIELAAARASTLGRRAYVSYFPFGIPSDERASSAPIARMRFVAESDVAPDALAPWIASRLSNKRPYERSRRPNAETLRNWAGWSKVADCDVGWTADAQQVAAIGRLVLEGIRIESLEPARRSEIAHAFRFSSSEREEHRDGVSIAQSGVTGVKRWMAETFFLSRSDALEQDGSFVKEGFALAQRQVESTPVWGWIATECNSRLGQVIAGRSYARSSLAAAGYGLAQHPMSQVLQEYSPTERLRAQLAKVTGLATGKTVQMLFRLGYAEPVEHTPRRALASIMQA